MMFPHDPLRQKMLFKQEWRTVGASGDTPEQLSESANAASTKLLEDGFQVSQMMPLTPARGIGVLIIGQRMTTPVADPTPGGAVIPGTHGIQKVSILYSFVEQGQAKKLEMKSLQEAVRAMAKDQDESALRGQRQPIAIHITSLTEYGPVDFAVLREKYG